MTGNQIPRIRIEPPRSATDGTGAAMLMQAYGVSMDEWQRLVLDCWLGTENGVYTVTSAGLSAPRQNGKNVCLEAREFYGLVVNGERILHTAHQTRTAKKAFRRLVAMFTDKKHPEICSAVSKIRYGIGEECIELHNGGTIEFTARTRQAARGYEGVSLVVYDEAQELTEEQAEALMSVLSASTTGIRQLIYTGTPPYPGCPGEVFRRLRQSAIMHGGKTAWHEWSIAAESITDINTADKSLWYETNPALGYRLTEEFTGEEFKTLSPDGFARERLGWWSEPTGTKVELAIDPQLWDSCRSDEGRPDGKTAYGIKFTADGSEVILAGAVIPSKGPARISLIEIAPTGRGLSWLSEWLCERYTKAACVVIDGRNGADLLIDKIRPVWRFKDSVIKASAQTMVAAASLLMNDLSEKNVSWYGEQEELRNSAITAQKRHIAGGWGFTSAPIEACSLALWGARTAKRNPQKKMRIG